MKPLQSIEEARTVIHKTGECYWEAETNRIKGILLPNTTQAEVCFQDAVDIARRQQAKSLELLASTSLARLWQRQGKRQEAYDLLAPVY